MEIVSWMYLWTRINIGPHPDPEFGSGFRNLDRIRLGGGLRSPSFFISSDVQLQFSCRGFGFHRHALSFIFSSF